MARAVEPRPPRGRWYRAARQGAEDTYGVPGRGGSAPVSVASALALLLLWWCVTELGLVRPLFLPSPGAVLSRFVRVLEEGFADASLWEHARASLSRVASAFALACVTAVPVGIAMGVNRHLHGALDPPLEFYRPIPPLAYLPLTIVWFGIGELQEGFTRLTLG